MPPRVLRGELFRMDEMSMRVVEKHGTSVLFDAPVWRHLPVHYTSEGLDVGTQQVMQHWERPLMSHLVRNATRRRGRVLEVGFGLGIASAFANERGCEEYCIIEAHPQIAEAART